MRFDTGTHLIRTFSAAAAIFLLLTGAARRDRRIDPFELPLGARIDSVVAELALPFSTRGPQRIVKNVEAIPRLFESQNLVLHAGEEGTLAAIHVQIVPDSGLTGADVLRLADDVRSRLIARFGAPAWERREGRARGEEVVFALSNGEVVRMSQWETKDRSIRAGIPRRIDGKVIVEIAITRERLPRGELFWSAE